jgi:hypothetical protein
VSCQKNVFDNLAKNHPYSYKLKWLHTKIEMEVNKICLVEFLYSKNYRDIITCDVHINVCHLLFGQSWQYYTRVIYILFYQR